jgi:hypothetical protein
MSKHDTTLTRKGRSSAKYVVGYKKPPAATRFPPGKSGNPKGRPKGGEAIEPAIFKVMDEPLVVTEGGKKRRMPAEEVILRGLRTKAMNGDVKAARFLMEQKEKNPDPAKRTLEDLTRDLSNHLMQMNEHDQDQHLKTMRAEELQAIARPRPMNRSDG